MGNSGAPCPAAPHIFAPIMWGETFAELRPKPEIAAKVMRILGAYLEPTLPKPIVIEDICLFGEGKDRRFHRIHRYALTG